MPRLGQPDRVRLAEAMRLADRIGDRIWPGWKQTAFQLLLVTDSAEFLIGSPSPTPEFMPLGPDSVLGREVWTRPRRFPPTLLATFPAVGGLPTVVIGTAERTGKSSTEWVLTVLHEHFHQWQYSQPGYYAGGARLDLARGDTTAQWMLDYPFPYDSAAAEEGVTRLAGALRHALAAEPSQQPKALDDVIAARERLRRSLKAADYRYLEFQFWQEGVARYIEYAVARAAAGSGQPSTDFRSLPDYLAYSRMADSARQSLRRELEQLDLRKQRRVAFYPLGAAIALLLEQTQPTWKQAYAGRPFQLATLLEPTARGPLPK
jgi:hypothetical protein